MTHRLDPNKLIKSLGRIASLPDVYTRLNAVMKRPDVSVQEIGEVVSEDPDLTARLLRLVNSPFYCLSNPIETVTRATLVIGFDELRDLALATSVVSQFEDIPEEVINMRQFWKHSIATGIGARAIAKSRRFKNTEQAFVSGMLHDIGKLVVYTQLPDLALEIITRHQRETLPFYRIENDVLGFNHTQLGVLLAKAWNLPETICNAIQFHHGPWAATAEVAIVHLGDLIANALRLGSSGEQLVPPLIPEAVEFLSFNPQSLGPLVQQIELLYNETVSSILTT